MRIDCSAKTLILITLAVVVACVCSPAVIWAQTGPVQYGYDELGRLVIVVDGAGNAGIYSYDAVGNLLSIQRINAADVGPVAIFSISPTRGKVGTTVSILGKGFGATAGQNTVQFSGNIVATIVSASPTGLRVTVPATAQDGPISVTAPAGSATSAQSFRVIGPVSITPASPTMSAGTTRQFAATGPGGSTAPALWSVNGVVGGSGAVGTISTSGLYTALPVGSPQITVTIGATDQNDPTATGALSLTVVSQRLAAAAQGVSVRFAQPTVTNSLQTSVSAVVGGTSVTKAVQASVSAVVGGDPVATLTTVVSASLGPVITGVSPAAGARGVTGMSVTLTGSGFTGATQVTFLRNNAADSNVTNSLVSVSPDGTQATLSVSIASGALTGDRVVQISTPSGASSVVGTGANVFAVQ